MTRALGVGVIGMGWMGAVHSRCYLQAAERFPEDDVKPKLVVCADDVEARAAKAKERFGFERQTTYWQDVIADRDVQVVSIATPNHLHLEIAKAAAAAGKHIFCEKPVGRTPRETAEIERVARQSGVLTFVGYNYRWAPWCSTHGGWSAKAVSANSLIIAGASLPVTLQIHRACSPGGFNGTSPGWALWAI